MASPREASTSLSSLGLLPGLEMSEKPHWLTCHTRWNMTNAPCPVSTTTERGKERGAQTPGSSCLNDSFWITGRGWPSDGTWESDSPSKRHLLIPNYSLKCQAGFLCTFPQDLCLGLSAEAILKSFGTSEQGTLRVPFALGLTRWVASPSKHLNFSQRITVSHLVSQGSCARRSRVWPSRVQGRLPTGAKGDWPTERWTHSVQGGGNATGDGGSSKSFSNTPTNDCSLQSLPTSISYLWLQASFSHSLIYRKSDSPLVFQRRSSLKKLAFRDCPGGPVVKYPPCDAGDTGSIPGWGTKIPHAWGQLNPPATTTEPVCHSSSLVSHNERSQVLQLRPDPMQPNK